MSLERCGAIPEKQPFTVQSCLVDDVCFMDITLFIFPFDNIPQIADLVQIILLIILGINIDKLADIPVS